MITLNSSTTYTDCLTQVENQCIAQKKRLAYHRFVDASGKDARSLELIPIGWIAKAAAEETLQGYSCVFTDAWLKLFRTHLSTQDQCYLRWQGDLAESAELRRAYSALYGRFFARALLEKHLGLTNFISLKRYGVCHSSGTNQIRVERGRDDRGRYKKGDIPDWLAWSESHPNYALCEAKGSLTATDFFGLGEPKCVRDGKKQLERVETSVNGKPYHPAQWVSATHWATDVRGGRPETILWDPSTNEEPFDEEKKRVHREIMKRAWLESIALRMGWSNAKDLLSEEREREELWVSAKPGPLSDSDDWKPYEDEFQYDALQEEIARSSPFSVTKDILQRTEIQNDLESQENLNRIRAELRIGQEFSVLERPFISAMITRAGIRPIKTSDDVVELQRAQESALNLQEPAMLVGIPRGIEPAARTSSTVWLDYAGIAQDNGLAVFDLRLVSFEQNR